VASPSGTAARDDARHLAQLTEWMRSYRPEELFDPTGAPRVEVTGWLPTGDLRMSANPITNGGRHPRELELPDFRAHAVKAGTNAEPTRVLGGWLRDVMAANATHCNFRLLGPDETASNHLDDVYAVTGKSWEAEVLPVDEHLDRHGRVMEILSEHICQGLLEGYLLTGRSRRSTTCSRRTCGGRTTTGSRTRTRASSITS